MDDLIIQPGVLAGEITVQPGKSMAHRLLIGSALAQGESSVAPLMMSDDVSATLNSLRAMGLMKPHWSGNGVTLSGGYGMRECTCQCGASGSTLRLLLPLALVFGKRAHFTGYKSLFERPMQPYFDAFPNKLKKTNEGIYANGVLSAGTFVLPGDVSSQFVSGLLFALPLLKGDSVIELTGRVESRQYIEMTLAALAKFGVSARWETENRLSVRGGQTYTRGVFTVPGDWSHAAFFIVAAALGGEVRLLGLDKDDVHGDRAIVDMLRSMGARLTWDADALVCSKGELNAREFDIRQCPDLAPALAVAACGAKGVTRLTGAARLRMKECNRLEGLAGQLTKLGADVICGADYMEIRGTGSLEGGGVDALGDHRLAMAFAVAAAICQGPVRLAGWETVKKSAPVFWDEFALLGGEFNF